MTHDDCPPFSIPPACTDEIDAWLADVRRTVPLAQPTAYQLARALRRGRTSTFHLTDDVQARLGPDPAVWEQDLADLYRQGFVCLWMAVGSPIAVRLMRDVRARAAAADPG